MFGNVISSLGTYFALQWDITQNVNAWLQGNFSLIDSTNYQLIYISLFSILGIIIGSHSFSVIWLVVVLLIHFVDAFDCIIIIGILYIILCYFIIILNNNSILFYFS